MQSETCDSKNYKHFIDDKLFYESTKVNFMVKVNSLQKPTSILTLKELKEKIDLIKKLKLRKNLENDDNSEILIFGCDVALLNGKEILIEPQGSSNCKQYLSYEDFFDLTMDVHLQFNHLEPLQMFHKMKSDYDVCLQSVSYFVNACETCPKKKSTKSVPFNKRVHIDMISMCHKPDNKFQYLLIYIEIETEFVLLRPILRGDVIEVSAELYKIFTDIGPPLEIVTSNTELLGYAMNLLRKAPIAYNCEISKRENHMSNHEISCRVIKELEKWTNYFRSNNWVMGCYIAQLHLNSKGPEETVFQKRFRNKVNIPYIDIDNVKVVNTSIINNIQVKEEKVELNEGREKLLNSDTLALHVEEDLGVDYGNIKEEIDITYENNIKHESSTIEECNVCHIKGASALFKCRVCKLHVHLICSNRITVEGHELTHSKVVCSLCLYKSSDLKFLLK